jgi:hypothetical protein
MRVTRSVTSYDFPRPAKLNEGQFIATKNSLPIRPYINVWGEFFKQWGIVVVACLLPPILIFALVLGAVETMYNYWSMLNKKKNFYDKLYDAIYFSNTYMDYSKKYDQLVPIFYRERRT